MSLLACALASGCLVGRDPSAAELAPTERASAPREPLPDEAERLAADLLRWSLDPGADPATARSTLQRLQQIDQERMARGEPPTDLSDNALDAFNATRGEEAFLRFSEDMLETGTPDPALRRKLETIRDAQPLTVAERRLSESRRRRVGELVNRLVNPISRALVGDPTAPLEAGRALIYSYSVLRSVSTTNVQERQALRAYSDFLQSSPGSPSTSRVAVEVQQLGEKLREQRLRETLKAARDALAAGRPDAALIHITRAEQTAAEDSRTQSLRRRAEAELRGREQDVRTTLAADPGGDSAFSSLSGGSQERMVVDILRTPLPDLTQMRGRWAPVDADLEDDLEFIEATGTLYSGDEDDYFATMQQLSGKPGNMARHAANVIESHDQNPYAVYRGARSARRRGLAGWLFLGNQQQSIPSSSLPLALRPLNTALELPYYIPAILGFPFRLVQFGGASARSAGPVLDAGELYLSRFPKGAHAQEIHRSLEGAYAQRGQWNKALEHQEARDDRDEGTIRTYRERVAERTLEFARLEDRPIDVRLAVYASLVREYGDTEAGRTAGREVDELRGKLTPQSIRLTREFLLANRELAGPGALGLRPELLDGEKGNGELDEDGVRLLGKTIVEIQLKGREPIQQRIPEQNFVRFVSLLEDVRYRSMAGDARERPISDPQLDQFLESARLGLTDDKAPRARARATSVIMTGDERYGALKRTDSILPIELVVRGGFSDAGLAALPRLKIPEESSDAFLYK